MKPKVTLQISLAPPDFPHSRHLLIHQLNAFNGQVDEILLTIETRPSKGRFATGWSTYETELYDFIQKDIDPRFNIRVLPVDYASSSKKDISQFFFGKNDIPDKDFRGGPFYAYFFGLFRAKHDIVIHLDSDMFLGGAGKNWIADALGVFEKKSGCAVVSPLPGPPHPEEILVGQNSYERKGHFMFEFQGMSTRIFMLDRSMFSGTKLSLNKPGIKNQIRAVLSGNSNADLPEHIISDFMIRQKQHRIDFLGSGQGMWSLHPPYRTPEFYHQLPDLIARVEQSNLPPTQYGFYDISDDLFDWTEAKQNLSRKRWKL